MSALTDKIDQRLAEFLPVILQGQRDLAAAYGSPCQLPWSHTVAPQDPVETAPDNLDEKLSHRSWRELGVLPPLMASRIKFDVHFHPTTGQVYVITLEAREQDGTRRVRITSINAQDQVAASPWMVGDDEPVEE